MEEKYFTTMATETVRFYLCRHGGNTVVLPADDLVDYACTL